MGFMCPQTYVTYNGSAKCFAVYCEDKVEISMAMEEFNALSIPEAQSGLFGLFHSHLWAAKVASGLPFSSEQAAIGTAEEVFDQLSASEIIRVVSHMPPVGQPNKDTIIVNEHKELDPTDAQVEELVTLNEQYKNKFGFTLIAYTAGKNASEVIDEASQRLNTDLATEFYTMRSELKKIVIHRFAAWVVADAMALTLSTSVFDSITGKPAAGIPVELLSSTGKVITKTVTSSEGRVEDCTNAHALRGATFTLKFDVESYFTSQNIKSFYPEIIINFQISSPETPYHIPLIISPYAYSTHRGSLE